ncbi:hypothetical protein MASR1M60_32210 [Rhodocyclaceae bacterium]
MAKKRSRAHADIRANVSLLAYRTDIGIFFHPDCDRRPWLCTRSADPAEPQALAGSPNAAGHTAGGEFHPAPKTPGNHNMTSTPPCASCPGIKIYAFQVETKNDRM